MPKGNNVTMKDIAELLGVSVMTVSKVINGHTDISEKTRDRVLKKIDEMGYTPNIMATNLRSRRGKLVALVLSDVGQPYFGRVIAGCEHILESYGYVALAFNSMEDVLREEQALRHIDSMRMAGVIIDPVQDSDPEQKVLRQLDIPYVFFNRFPMSGCDYSVAADNEEAGYLASAYLLESRPGRPVICVNGPARITPTVHRYEGYLRALGEAGRTLEPGSVFDNCFDLTDAYNTGREIAEQFEPPFSIFCSTDQIAIGVLRALRDSHLQVPRDVSVIGVDDIDIARYHVPALSTVALPRRRIGEESAYMLISLIEGKPIEEPHIFLKPDLVLRETTIKDND